MIYLGGASPPLVMGAFEWLAVTVRDADGAPMESEGRWENGRYVAAVWAPPPPKWRNRAERRKGTP